VRRSKEIIVLAVLLAGMIGYVLWYVIDRRARLRAAQPVAVKPVPPVDLMKHDGQTIDFSSGRPVVKDSAEDRAAIAKAKQEMDEAAKDVTFGPPAKKSPPPEPAPPKKN
jgi:hypothetical protein